MRPDARLKIFRTALGPKGASGFSVPRRLAAFVVGERDGKEGRMGRTGRNGGQEEREGRGRGGRERVKPSCLIWLYYVGGNEPPGGHYAAIKCAMPVARTCRFACTSDTDNPVP